MLAGVHVCRCAAFGRAVRLVAWMRCNSDGEKSRASSGLHRERRLLPMVRVPAPRVLVEKVARPREQAQALARPVVCVAHVGHGEEHDAAGIHDAHPVLDREQEIGHMLEDVVADQKVEFLVLDGVQPLRVVGDGGHRDSAAPEALVLVRASVGRKVNVDSARASWQRSRHAARAHLGAPQMAARIATQRGRHPRGARGRARRVRAVVLGRPSLARVLATVAALPRVDADGLHAPQQNKRIRV